MMSEQLLEIDPQSLHLTMAQEWHHIALPPLDVRTPTAIAVWKKKCLNLTRPIFLNKRQKSQRAEKTVAPFCLFQRTDLLQFNCQILHQGVFLAAWEISYAWKSC